MRFGLSNRPRARVTLWAAVAVLYCLITAVVAHAGPPFFTDDPVPVPYRNWELYAATQDVKEQGGKSGTAPHFEANYGALPELQLHMIVPLAWDRPQGESTQYGLGDLEVGAKYRFIHEGKVMPQVGAFPILTLPTGDDERGLGEGRANLFLPVWLQKSWGRWTSYGGGGYWIHPGEDNQNYWFTGVVLQRQITDWLALGGELFQSTADTVDGGDSTGYNFGAMIDFSEEQHLLISGGSDLHGDTDLTFYLAYQLTFGPPVK
ncbi:MAG: transporter [Deltaproteobacteria bacterium]|nr:transporter [Deltaproteobacteria bacterium]